MGGGSFVSPGTDEGSCLEKNFSLFSSSSSHALRRNNLNLQELSCSEIDEESKHFSPISNFGRRRPRVYKDIFQCCDELEIDSKDLKREKQKILRYRPGAWIEKVGDLKTSDYDVPKTTCLLLVGPSGSGKSSLINRISKVLEDDKSAPARTQESYNSLIGDGTYFLQEYMIPRDSDSICLCDTRSLSDISDKDENNRMLKSWMTKGVHHGELIVRKTDNKRLKKNLKDKAYKKDYFSSKTRKVNSVIYVVNGLLVLKAMENAGALETQYIETIVSTFNCPFLSFKDDKPVLVFTHGDLLSLSERALVRAHLGSLLGIPPTKQIFDIPDCDCPVTESAIIGMLRYSLAHADRNFSHKNKVMDMAHKVSVSLYMVVLILGIGAAVGLIQNTKVEVPHPKLKVSKCNPTIEWHKTDI